jgi:hypothetical protein
MILGKGAQTSQFVRRIRELFLEPKASYSLTTTARVLEITVNEVRAWVDAGEMESQDGGGAITIPWSEIVAFGMDIWSQAAVEEALGADLAETIPELLRLTELSVLLPRFEVAALQTVAAHERRTVDALLAAELLDFVSARSTWLAGEISGFADALAWPATAQPTSAT